MFMKLPVSLPGQAPAEGNPQPHRRPRRRALAAGAAVALVAGLGTLASSAAFAAPAAVQHPAAAARTATVAIPATTTSPGVPVVATGTYDCGTKGQPEMLGTIGWTPASGSGGIGVIKMWFWAHDCKVLSGKFKGQTINTVNVQADFPIDPNGCPFLPAAGTYRENLYITYPGVNFGVQLAPSVASVNVNPAAAWTFAKGLVGGSFANAAAVSAQFRPILWVGSCPSVRYMTLAQTSLNELLNF
jgi:hypothetical protein